MYYVRVFTHNTRVVFHSVSKRSKIQSAKERIHFAFLQFRKGREEINSRLLFEEMYSSIAVAAFFVRLPKASSSLSLFPPFKALVSSTIQILIQLRRPPPPPSSPTATRLSRVSPSFFFFFCGYTIFFFLDFFKPLSPPIPAKSEFNYDSSRNRFPPHTMIRGLSHSRICRPWNVKMPLSSLLSSSLCSMFMS